MSLRIFNRRTNGPLGVFPGRDRLCHAARMDHLQVAALDAGRCAAVLWIAGFATFLTGAAFWKMEYQADLETALKASFRDAKRMRWICLWMIVGNTLNLLGTVAFSQSQASFGATLLATCASVLMTLGSVFFLINITLRWTVLHRAGERATEQGSLPENTPAMSEWAGALFTLFIVMTHGAVIVLGISLLKSGLLADWVGWLGIGWGGVILAGYTAMKGGPFSPPILVHVWPLVAGTVLLLSL